MRGRPFVQFLLVFLAFVMLGVPVWRLTRPTALTAADLPPPPEALLRPAEVELTLTASFAPAPEEFHLQSLGHDLLTGRGPQAEWTDTWKTSLPPEGADLSLQARWPTTDAPAAVRVVIRFPDDRPPMEKMFWASHGNLTELVTVPGTPR